MKQYVSYSELDLWERDQSEYRRRYIEGVPQTPHPRMILGTIIHEAIQDPQYPLLRELREQLGMTYKRCAVIKRAVEKIPAAANPEYTLRAELEDFKLFGKADDMEVVENKRIKLLHLTEYKTTDIPKSWHQTRVDRDRQISFYYMIYYLSHHTYLNGARLWRIDTVKGTAKKFDTARGPEEIQSVKTWTIEKVKEINAAGLWEKRLSKKEIEQLNQPRLDLPGVRTRGWKKIGD